MAFGRVPSPHVGRLRSHAVVPFDSAPEASSASSRRRPPRAKTPGDYGRPRSSSAAVPKTPRDMSRATPRVSEPEAPPRRHPPRPPSASPRFPGGSAACEAIKVRSTQCCVRSASPRSRHLVAAELPRPPSTARSSMASKEKPVAVPPLVPRRDCRPVATPQKCGIATQSGCGPGAVPPRSSTPFYTSVESAVIALASETDSRGKVADPLLGEVVVPGKSFHYSSGGSSSSSREPLLPHIGKSQSRSTTPSQSKLHSHGQASGGHRSNCSAVASGAPVGYDIAEMWLRLARLAILELGQLRPSRGRIDKAWASSNDSKSQGSSKTSLQHDQTSLQTACSSQAASASDMMTAESLRCVQAWKRIVTRVLAVTTAGPSCGAAAIGEGIAPVYRDGSLCLGEMMQESITWVEVDSEDGEDDFLTPKASLMMEDPPNQASEVDGYLAQGMKVIAMQQRAPGVLDGMPKCLSF